MGTGAGAGAGSGVAAAPLGAPPTIPAPPPDAWRRELRVGTSFPLLLQFARLPSFGLVERFHTWQWQRNEFAHPAAKGLRFGASDIRQLCRMLDRPCNRASNCVGS